MIPFYLQARMSKLEVAVRNRLLAVSAIANRKPIVTKKYENELIDVLNIVTNDNIPNSVILDKYSHLFEIEYKDNGKRVIKRLKPISFTTTDGLKKVITFAD